MGTESQQRTFDFDFATLESAVSKIDQSIRHLVRALLLCAVRTPRSIIWIDDNAKMVLVASFPHLSRLVSITDRHLRRIARSLHQSSGIQKLKTQNTDAEWEIDLSVVLPAGGLEWFQAIAESGEMSGLTSSNVRADITRMSGLTSSNVRADISPMSGLTSQPSLLYGLALKLSLAQLGFPETEVTGDRWENLTFPPSALDSAKAIDALYRQAVTDGLMPDTIDCRSGVFVLAIRSRSQNARLNWFRRAIMDRYDRDQSISRDVKAEAKRLQREADGGSAAASEDPIWKAQRQEAERQRAAAEAARAARAAETKPVSMAELWKQRKAEMPSQTPTKNDQLRQLARLTTAKTDQ